MITFISSDAVEIFYPEYASKYGDKYNGGSMCSIDNCGVHKIEPEFARKLFAVGQKKLETLWQIDLEEIYQKKEEEQKLTTLKNTIDVGEDWKALVEKAYESLEDTTNGEEMYKIGEEYLKKH